MKRIFLGLIILITVGCGNNTEFTNSCYQDEANFRWDFSKQKKIIYSFSQTVNGENQMSKSETAEKSYMSGLGSLNVNVKEDHFADVSLSNIEMTMIMYNKDGSPSDTMKQKAPVSIVQDMKPDGNFVDDANNVIFDLLLPLPNSTMKQGESYDIPMEMPFNANGTRLKAKGQNTLTFLGCGSFEGRDCAVLKGVIDISNLDVPEELEGEYISSTTGEGTYYFDLKNGYFVGADVQMVMNSTLDAGLSGEDQFGMYAKMKSENNYEIRLKEIEE